ncbi:MAG: hypothetical protein WDN01_18410 [Rhizomicrobium sp.]
MIAAVRPVKYAARAYILELIFVQALYILAAVIRPWLIAHAANADWALAARIVPAIPIWLTFGVIWRYYRRIDEFERLKFLQTLAVSFGVGSCVLITYAVLSDAVPSLAITWAWPTLAVSWALTTAIMSLAQNHAK